jgi:aminomethyltransferase
VDPIAPEAVTPDVYAGPFHGVQKAAGATFYEDMGALWTKAFGDPVDEYWAVRRGAGLWDASSLVKYRLSGPDALPALDGLTTRRVSGSEPGLIRYCNVLNEQGLMLDEGTNLVVSAREAYYFGNDDRPEFLDHLERYATGLDVRIERATESIPNIAVQGPKSFEILSRLTETDFAGLPWFRLIPEPVRIAGVPGLLTRTGFTGEVGYEFFLLDGGAGAEKLWKAILDAGAEPIGLDAIEKLRIEAGLVIQGEDYFPGETDPYELNMDPFIDLDGHDFVGKDAAARVAEAPPRRFVTLEFDGVGVPEAGSDVSTDGMPVGDVRSAGKTPRFGALALAVVAAEWARTGERLEAGGLPATVRGLPIDDPDKLRPRSDPRKPFTVD